jgi:hypothetical protein
VPYLDVSAAAHLLAEFADDESMRRSIGSALQRLARGNFDRDRYLRRLDELGIDAVRIMRQRSQDFAILCDDPLFDQHVYLPLEWPAATREEAISGFLARWTAVGTSRQPASNGLFRRPCAGFHPQIYAHENSERYDARLVNPLAHFIRSGKPHGPWWHDVITPTSSTTDSQASSAAKADDPVTTSVRSEARTLAITRCAAPQTSLRSLRKLDCVAGHDKSEISAVAIAPLGDASAQAAQLRTVLHGHFFYPELASELMAKLKCNCSGCDLIFTTDSEAKAKLLRKTAKGYSGGGVQIRVVPNRGRDIGAFLAELASYVSDRYDVIGHVHGKRSLAVDAALGENWREFLWQNLIGDKHPMMDVILDRFATDATLGIAFPQDPHLSDWDANLGIAESLAARMGIEEPLPPFFDFPVGTMFWARTEALKPLLALSLDWNDYPEEPLPIDGTVLHAIERLLPFAARHVGYRYATTHVPGVTW